MRIEETTTATATVRREVDLPGEPGEVWAALSEPERLAAWFGAEAAGHFGPGGRLEFRWPDGSRRDATIEEWEPERRLAFRWAPFDRALDGRTRRMPPTRVRFDLQPAPGGTHLEVREEAA